MTERLCHFCFSYCPLIGIWLALLYFSFVCLTALKRGWPITWLERYRQVSSLGKSLSLLFTHTHKSLGSCKTLWLYSCWDSVSRAGTSCVVLKFNDARIKFAVCGCAVPFQWTRWPCNLISVCIHVRCLVSHDCIWAVSLMWLSCNTSILFSLFRTMSLHILSAHVCSRCVSSFPFAASNLSLQGFLCTNKVQPHNAAT